MRSGICPKCGSTEVRTAVNGLYTGTDKGIRVVRKLMATRSDVEDYVCPGCGYFERYLRPGPALWWVGGAWQRVRPRTEDAVAPGYGVQDAIPPGYRVQDAVPGDAQ